PDRCLAKATWVIPPKPLSSDGYTVAEVREGVLHAYECAARETNRAVTHNKGIMDGIETVMISTENDWSEVRSGAHAYAARDCQYRSMTTWSQDEQGNLVGELELPMSLGIVGGASRVHPLAKVAYDILQVESAKELAQVITTVGLAQNL